MEMKRISVRLPNNLLLECQMAGERFVADLKNPSVFRDVQSAALSSHGAEANVNLQTNAKAAECAFCLWAGLDPLKELNWRHADSGYDLKWLIAKIDVKHTKYHNGALIWPINKRFLLEQKVFDIFVLVTGQHDCFDLCGWTTRNRFINEHKTADEEHRLTSGTWFMEQENLLSMDSLSAAIEFWTDLTDGDEDYDEQLMA